MAKTHIGIYAPYHELMVDVRLVSTKVSWAIVNYQWSIARQTLDTLRPH